VLPEGFARASQTAFSGFKITWSSREKKVSGTSPPGSSGRIQYLEFRLSLWPNP
jgi:hypothetical protein